MSTLMDLQQTFAQDAAKLIQKAVEMGFAVTLGEAWRTPEQAQWNAAHHVGVQHSLHEERLAIDLNLFQGGHYLQDDSTGAYSRLGNWWKTLGTDHCWGGDFHPLVDLDHFSITPDGVHK